MSQPRMIFYLCELNKAVKDRNEKMVLLRLMKRVYEKRQDWKRASVVRDRLMKI